MPLLDQLSECESDSYQNITVRDGPSESDDAVEEVVESKCSLRRRRIALTSILGVAAVCGYVGYAAQQHQAQVVQQMQAFGMFDMDASGYMYDDSVNADIEAQFVMPMQMPAAASLSSSFAYKGSKLTRSGRTVAATPSLRSKRFTATSMAAAPMDVPNFPSYSSNMDPPAIVRPAPENGMENSVFSLADAAVAPAPEAQQKESPFTPGGQKAPYKLSYGRFVEGLDNYERVVFSADGQTATATNNDGKKYFTSPIINAPALVQRATDLGIDVVISPPQTPGVGNFFLSAASYILPPLFLFWLFVGRNQQQGGGMGGGGMNPMGMGKSNAKFQMEPDTGVKFPDVAGCDEAKGELVEVVDFLKNPDKYSKLGAKIPRGVVLEGPPGTGKTLLARAVAGEAGVPFFASSGSEFVEMFVGVGASRVRDLFENAKKNAPCIVFIDEIDAIGRARGGNGGFAGGNQEQENTLNQILTEMDGFDGASGVIVMAATNRADVLDQALLRPGRFDRRTTVGLPDLNGRIEILKVHTRGKPLADDVDLKSIAKRTMGFSGASLQNLMNEGAIYAARRMGEVITAKDIDAAIDRIIVGLEKKGTVQTDSTKRTVAYHEAGHALLGALVPDFDLVQKITIIPRSNGAGGLTFFSPSEERLGSGLYSREYLECQLAVALGGRLAEELVFGERKVTTGASSDIQQVARIARSMVTEWGMSDVVGAIAIDSQGGMMSQGPTYSTETLQNVDDEVMKLVNNAYALGKKLLSEHRPVLDDVAQALLEEEQIDGIQFQKILNKYSIVPKAYSDLSLEDLQAAGYIPKELPADIAEVAAGAGLLQNPQEEVLTSSQFKNALEMAEIDFRMEL